jgi:hypothetical protein
MTGNDVPPLDDFPLKRDDASSHMMSRDFFCEINFAPFSLYKMGEGTNEIENGEYGV